MTGPLVLVLTLLAGFGLRTTPSEAHASLVSSVPARRATVTSPPPRVVLTFNERLEPAFTRVSVWDASGQQIDLKDGAVDPSNPKVVNVSLPPLRPGRYTVRYRVLSVDGHIVEASFLFSVAPAAPRR
ncbi:MAG: copper resistance CopC family protein [Actinomycetota bacterium]